MDQPGRLPQHGNARAGTESLLREANARLHPSWTNPNFLTLRARSEILAKWAGEIPGERLSVLDVGGRYQPYRPLLRERVERYVGVDVLQTELVSVVASGEALPFAAESFDVVIATQVFEYFADPSAAAQEVWRVLKSGGVLLGSCAACTPRIVDEEHWRFTPAGLKALMRGFSRVDIIPEVHSVGGLVRTVNQGLDSFTRYRVLRSLYRVTGCPLLNGFGLAAEKMGLTTNDQFTPNYSVRAVK
jgi:SAM-dependent methyltransferase